MNRDQVTRSDFPIDGGGYDRASVDAHLQAVAALMAALEAQVKALEVEREALKRTARTTRTSTGEMPPDPEPADPEPAPEPSAGEPDPSGSKQHPGEPEAGGRSQDEVSARLVATKMVLDGAERDTIVAHLDEAYELPDPGELVDDVLTRLT
jgi:hypothetical protein